MSAGAPHGVLACRRCFPAKRRAESVSGLRTDRFSLKSGSHREPPEAQVRCSKPYSKGFILSCSTLTEYVQDSRRRALCARLTQRWAGLDPHPARAAADFEIV